MENCLSPPTSPKIIRRMNVLLIVMLYLIVPALMITFLESCFAVLPRENQWIQGKWVWLLLIPVGCRVVNGIMAPLLGIVLWSVIDLVIFLGDTPLRIMIFVGLAKSFVSFFASKSIQKGTLGMVLALTVSGATVAYLAGCAGAVLWMLTHSFADPVKDRPAWVVLFSDGPPAVTSLYALFLFVYLSAMGSLKNAVTDLDRRERIQKRAPAPRKAKTKENNT